ncbi:MAG: glutaminase A [Tepidisphaeraceae bacterium]
MNSAEALPTPLHGLLSDIVSRHRKDHSGEVATYIPELARANPDWFGVCLVTAEGAVYEVGDSRQDFTIQSISKPFAYALALETAGREAVRSRVGVEPSGDAFNSISLQPSSGRPLNPMINAGAIAISGLLYQSLQPDPLQNLLDRFSGFAGRPLEIDQKVYESESSTGHRNRAIAHLLRNFDVLEDPVEQSVDLYFQQCSILTTCYDLAVMAATLANRGINPVTGDVAMSPDHVDSVLSVMTTCGMYNYAGQWLYDVGVPAKSGVAGGILAVLPGRMGIGAFSPRLDAQGNSVRGIKVCQELSERFRLHLFSAQRSGRSVVRTKSTLQHRHSSRVRGDKDARMFKSIGRAAAVLELQGDLQFSAMEIVQRRAWEALPEARILLLDLSRVDSVDVAGAEGIRLMIAQLKADGRQVVLSGLAPDSAVRAQLGTNGDAIAIFDGLDDALEACETSLLRNVPVSGNNAAANSMIQALPVRDLEVACALEPDEVRHLEKLLVRREFAEGMCICRKGDDAREIYFLTCGRVSVRLYSNATVYQRLAAFAPGAVFGEMAVIDRGRRSADVWTESAGECYTLSLDDLDRLGRERPGMKIKLLEYLMRVLTSRLRRANDLIGHLAS